VNGTRTLSAEGGALTLDGTQIILDGSGSFTGRASGDLNLNAGLFADNDGDLVTLNADYDFAGADTVGDGAGDLVINSPRLDFASGAFAATSFTGTGQNITVTGVTDVQTADTGDVAGIFLTAQGNVDLGSWTQEGSIADFTVSFGQDGSGGTLDMNNASIASAVAGTRSLNGGGGSDEIIAPASGAAFTLSGVESGQVIGSIFVFSSVENLTGGVGNDTFALDGGTLSGTVNGGGGSDTIFVNDNTGRAFTIDGPNEGDVADITGGFTSIENLTGGSGVDTFDLTNDMDGVLDGGAGIDIVNINGAFNAGTSFDVTAETIDDNGVNTITAGAINLTGVTSVGATDGMDIDATSLNITGGNGSVSIIETDVTTSDGLSLAGIDTGTGAFTLDATGTVTVNGAFNVDSADIEASGDIEDDGASSIATVNDLVLNSSSGGIGTTGDGLDIAVGGSLAGASGSTIDLNASGALDISGAISATTSVDLSATGAVTDMGNTASVAGTTVSLSGTAIGVIAGNPIDTSADTLSLSASNGDIHVDEADGVTLNTVTASGALDIETLASGAMTLSDAHPAVESTGGQPVTLTTANGSILETTNDTVVDIRTAGAVTLTAIGGTVGDTAVIDGAIDVSGTTDLNASGDGGTAVSGDTTLSSFTTTVDPANETVDVFIQSGDTIINFEEDGSDNLQVNQVANNGSLLNFDLTADSNNILLSSSSIANIGAGDVTLTAVGGGINEITVDDGGVLTPEIATDGIVALSAATGIGSTSALDIAESTIGAGFDLVVQNNSATRVDIQTQGAVTVSGFNTGGDTILNAASPVNTGNFNGMGGDVTFRATGQTDADDLTVDGIVETADAGNIELMAGDDVIFTDTGGVRINDPGADGAAGNIDIIAGVDYNGGTHQEGFPDSGRITPPAATGTATISAVDGTISLLATDSINLTDVDIGTTGSIVVRADHDFNAEFGLNLSNGVGAVTDAFAGDGAGNENLAAPTVTISAATGIGDGDAIDTAAGSLDITNTTSGAILIAEIDGVTLTVDQDATAATTVTAGGTILVSDVNTVDTSASAVQLTATTGGIRDAQDDSLIDITTGAGGAITLTADADIDGNGGIDNRLELAAGSIVDANSVTAGDIRLAGTGALELLDVETTEGAIDVTTDSGDLTVTSVTAGGTNNVSLATTTTGSILTAGPGLNVTANELNLTASTGIGGIGADDELESAANIISFTNSTGDVGIINTKAGGVTVDGDSGTGNIAITENSGTLIVGASDLVTQDGTISLNVTPADAALISVAGSDIDSVNGGTGGAVSLIADDLQLGGNITAGDQLVTLAPNEDAQVIDIGTDTASVLGITDAELDNITTTGGLTIGAASNTGGVEITAPVSPGSVTGTTTLLQGSGNIAVADAGSFSSGIEALTLDTNTGAIQGDGGNTATDLTAGMLALNAGTAIGGTNGVETAATTLVADVSGAGNIAIDEANGVTVGAAGITANDGSINLSTQGAGDIELDGTVGAVTTVDITVVDGSLLDVDANGSITGTTVTLDASAGIGSLVGNPIQTTADNLDLNAGTDVFIDESNAVVIDGLIAAQSDLTAGGAITDAPNATIGVTNRAVFDAGTNSITLGDAGVGDTTNFGSLVGSGDTITITEDSATQVDDITAGTAVILISGGAITQDNNAEINLTVPTADLSASGGITLDTEVADLTAATSAAGDINIDEFDGITLTSLFTNDGAITVTAGDTIIATSVETSNTDADANDITLNTTAGIGDIALGSLTTGGTAGDITLVTAGAVTDADGATDITAHEVDITSAGGVSADTAVTNLAISAGGIVDLSNTGNLVITDVTGTQGTVSGVTGSGGTTITATSPLTIDSVVADGGGGDIILAAEGILVTDDLAINADITASGGNGDISLFAGDSISQSGGTTVDAAGTGAINYFAGTNYNGGAPQNGINTGVITMASSALASTDAGGITLRAPEGIALGTLDTDDNDDNVAGDVEVSADFDGVQGGQSNDAGAITDVSVDTVTDITGGLVTLNAATGIGTAAGDEHIDLTANEVNATNTTDGGIFLNLVGDTGAGNVTISASAQDKNGDTIGEHDVDILSDGDILITSADAVDDMAVTTLGGSLIDGGSDTTADLTGTTITLAATDGGIGAAGANDSIDVDAGTVSASTTDGGSGGGSIFLNSVSGATVTFDVVNAAGAGQDVELLADATIALGSITATNAVNATASTGNIDDASDDNIADLTATEVNLTTTIGSIGGNAPVGGGIDFRQDIEIDAASVSLNAADGNLAAAESVSGAAVELSSSNGGVDFLADNTIHVGVVDAGANDDVTLRATSGSLFDAADDTLADIIANNIELTADAGDIGGSDPVPGGGTDPDDLLEVNPANTLTLSSNGAFLNDLSGNAITLNFAGSIFNYTASGDILIDLIDAAGTVTLETSGGSINDAMTDTVTDINGTDISLTARDEIGAMERLELNGDSVTAVVTNAGDIALTDSGGTILANIDSASGNINIDSDGSLELDTVTTNGSGTVDISTNAGALTDTNANASDVSGTTVILSATTGIGTTTDHINTTAGVLDLTTTGNAIVINETDAVDLANVGAPDFSLDAGGPITDSGALTVGNLTTLSTAGTENIRLDFSANNFGEVEVLSALNVALVDSSGITLNEMAFEGDLSVQSGDTLVVADNISSNGVGDLSLISATSIDQNANLITGGGTLDVDASAGEITMSPTALSASNGGNIQYRATGDIELGIIDAGMGSISLISLADVLDAQNDTVGMGANGFATQTNDPRVVNIIGSALFISAENIGVAGNPVDIEVANLAGELGTNAYLYETSGLTLGAVGPIEVQRLSSDFSKTTVSDAGGAGLTGMGGVVKVETVGGALTADEAVQAGSDVLLAAGGAGSDLQTNAPVTSTGTGHITLLSQNAISQSADMSTQGGTVTAHAVDDSITMGSVVSTAANNGDLRYEAGLDINVGILNAGAGNLSLIAGGDISDTQGDTVGADATGFAVQTGNARVENLIGTELRLGAGGDVGEAGNPLDTAVDQVAGTVAGNITLYETDGLTLSTATVSVEKAALDSGTATTSEGTATGLTGTGGVVKVETIDGGLSVDEPVQAGSDILLAAGGAGNDLSVNSAVDSTGAGHITLLSQDTISQNADISTQGGSIFAQAVDDGIIMDGGVSSTSNGGDLVLRASSQIELNELDAGSGNLYLETGTDILNLGGLNLTGSTAFLSAGNGIGVSGTPVSTALNQLAARAGAGGIFLTETGALTIDEVSLDATVVHLDGSTSNFANDDSDLITTSNGPISLVTGGDLTLEEGVTTAGNGAITLNGSGNLFLSSAGELTANAAVTGGSGHLTLSATDGINLNANITTGGSGTLLADVTDGGITMDDNALASTDEADIRLTARNGDVILGGIDAGTSGNILVSASESIIDGGDSILDMTGNGLILIAAQGVGVAAEAIDLSANALSGSGGAGGFHVSDPDTLDVDTVSVNVEAVSDTALTTTLSESLSGITTDSGGDVNIDAGTDLTISQSVSSDAGSIQLLAGNNFSQDSPGDISTESSGEITVDADNNGNGTGSITMNDGATTRSAGGDILYLAPGDIVIGGISSDSGQVRMESAGGNLLDGGGSDADLAGPEVILLASNGSIGLPGDFLDGEIDNLSGTSSSSGFYFNNTGDLNLLAVDGIEPASGGDMILNIAGNLDLSTLTASGILDATATGNITDSGTLLVGGTAYFEAGGDVVLDSPQNIFDSDHSGDALSFNATNVVLVDAGDLLLDTVVTFAGGQEVSPAATGNVEITTGSTGAAPFNLDMNNTTVGGSLNVSAVNTVDFNTVSVGENLMVTTHTDGAGAITDSGTFTVGGNATFVTGLNPITLDESNDFQGLVSLANEGDNLVILRDDSGSLTLGSIEVGSDLLLTTSGLTGLGAGSVGRDLRINNTASGIEDTAGGLLVSRFVDLTTAGASSVIALDSTDALQGFHVLSTGPNTEVSLGNLNQDILLDPAAGTNAVDAINITGDLDVTGDNITIVGPVITGGSQSYDFNSESVGGTGLMLVNADLSAAGPINLNVDNGVSPTDQAVPRNATIFADRPEGLIMTADSINVGQHEILLASEGDIQLTTINDLAIGDLNSRGRINLQVGGSLNINARIRRSGGADGGDAGIDFVSGDENDEPVISMADFNLDDSIQQTVFVGSATGTATITSGTGALFTVTQQPLDTLTFDLPIPFLDLIAQGATQENLAEEIAGANPTIQTFDVQSETIAEDLLEALVQIGVYARRNTPAETIEGLKGYAIYVQDIDRFPPRPSDYYVHESRISEVQVRQILNAYTSLVGGSGDASKIPAITQTLAQTFSDYRNTVEVPDPVQFGVFARNQDEKTGEILDRYEYIFRLLTNIGLSSRELEVSKLTILRQIRVPGLVPANLIQAIEQGIPRNYDLLAEFFPGENPVSSLD